MYRPSKLNKQGGQDETGEYNVAAGWPGPFAKPGYIQGAISGVFAESPNRIFVMNRGEIKLPEKLPNGFNGSWGSTGERTARPPSEPRNFFLIFDDKGKLIESWTQYDRLFAETKGSKGPHKVKTNPYDLQRHVWIIDDTGHRVLEFSNNGKQLVRGKRQDSSMVPMGSPSIEIAASTPPAVQE